MITVLLPFKLDPSCAYSDTDSVFTKDISKLIKLGKELGLFKDELSPPSPYLIRGQLCIQMVRDRDVLKLMKQHF